MKIHIYCKILTFFINVYSQLPIKYITIKVYFHNVESILELRFFYHFFSNVNSPDIELTCKALGQFLFILCIVHMVFFDPAGSKSQNE